MQLATIARYIILNIFLLSLIGKGAYCFGMNLTDAEKMTVTIPGPLSGYKQRNPFVEALIGEIYAVQGDKVNLKYFEEPLSQGRAIEELRRNRHINLNWSMTSVSREKKLLAIKIPIYKGLIGWRVFFIRRGEEPIFAKISSLTSLRKLKAIQRHDWPDYKVLKHNGLAVEGDFKFEYMSKAITAGFADYFPRSVLEILRESSHERFSALAIEPTILMKYPAAFYFFVNRNNKELATYIEKGFKKLIETGRFDELFDQHFESKIKPLNLEKRTVIELENPYFKAN